MKQSPPQPYPLRRCYLDGRNVQVKQPDDFLLIILPNGRSFNYCIPHWRKFTAVAPPAIVDAHRRKNLREYESLIPKEKALKAKTMNAKGIMAQLDWMRRKAERSTLR